MKKVILVKLMPFLVLLSITGITNTGCSPRSIKQEANPTLLVGAAADTQKAMVEIADAFEKKEGTRPQFTFGSSSMLAEQIKNGAPIDVFLSADMSFVRKLQDENKVWPETVTSYAQGKLVLAAAPGSGKIKSLQELQDNRIKKIAIANPDHAPYGRAARQALQNADLWDKLAPRLVYTADVGKATTLVETGNTEAGFLPLSLVVGTDLSYVLVDQALYQPLQQGAAVTKGSKNEALARKFLEFITGPEGRTILRKYGFEVP